MLLLFIVPSLSHVQLLATPWTAAYQVSLSSTICWSLLKLMSIEMVMPSNHLILCHPLLLLPSIFPSISVFSMSQLFASGGRSIGASVSAPVLPMNIQGWFSLGLTGLISLLSKGLPRVFFSMKIQKHQFFNTRSSLWSNSHIHPWLLANINDNTQCWLGWYEIYSYIAGNSLNWHKVLESNLANFIKSLKCIHVFLSSNYKFKYLSAEK